jgi:hypothetical protein
MSELILPPHLSKFQQKNQIDESIMRLVKVGLFPNKEAVMTAALTLLFEELVRAQHANMPAQEAPTEAVEPVQVVEPKE